MLLDTAFILQSFVLLNPLSSFPVLMAAYKKKLNVRQIAIRASIVAFLIALLILFFGPQLFGLYGISTDAFRIAGGAVLFLLGLDTVRPKPKREDVDEVDSLVAIIATPLLTGPAVISFLTIKAIEQGAPSLVVDVSVAFGIVGIVFFLFSLALPRVNEKVIEILSKVMGLFLMAIAIEMLAKGTRALLLSSPA
ncbi:MAG: MarC family protein [Candidatus Micrarchaeota archaeon]|nr:MarC family protein [Candidatus Micrarchaeota archaeon]